MHFTHFIQQKIYGIDDNNMSADVYFVLDRAVILKAYHQHTIQTQNCNNISVYSVHILHIFNILF